MMPHTHTGHLHFPTLPQVPPRAAARARRRRRERRRGVGRGRGLRRLRRVRHAGGARDGAARAGRIPARRRGLLDGGRRLSRHDGVPRRLRRRAPRARRPLRRRDRVRRDGRGRHGRRRARLGARQRRGRRVLLLRARGGRRRRHLRLVRERVRHVAPRAAAQPRGAPFDTTTKWRAPQQERCARHHNDSRRNRVSTARGAARRVLRLSSRAMARRFERTCCRIRRLAL